MRAIRFVLVRPEHGANVGAAARALKNMGQAELWLVRPRPFDAKAAARLAHGAADVLEQAHRVARLEDAVGDCLWVAGTSRRRGRRRAIEWTPRGFADAVRATPERRPLAVVFGPEADGLSSADLACCQDLIRIPSAPAQPSLNLAQAVLVVAYELFVAGVGAGAAPAAAPRRPAGGGEADGAALAALWAHLESMLIAVGFASARAAPARMVALRRALGRARLRRDEVRLLRGVCRQAEWAAAHGPARRRPV